MRHLFLLIIILTTHYNIFSQDNLVESSCDCLNNLLKTDVGKIEFQFAHDECFKGVYSKLISFSSTDSSDAVYTRFMDNLEKSCEAYNKCHSILDKMTLEKSPIRIQNKKSCKQTMQIGEFEDRSGNEKIVMSMRDSIQVVTFGDKGLYTKSKVEWIDECSYKVIFIESTNPFENGILKKGDEREIRIIDIRKNDDVIFEVGMYDRWFLGKVKKLK
jgi:hypothetical protein